MAAPSEALGQSSSPPKRRALRKIPGSFNARRPQRPPRHPNNRFAHLSEAALDDALKPRIEPFPQRLERLSRGLRGAPYLRSPLGEGAAPDPDPRFRLDAFDCTTFVETTIALAYGSSLADSRQQLDRLRYFGRPEFDHRRHLVTAQWRPGLQAEGVLEDITQAIGSAATRRVELKLSPRRWRRRHVARHLKLPEAVIPSGLLSLPYLPLKAALARLQDIPAGTVVNIVRAARPKSPVVVTHQGLIIQRPGDRRLYVRHASPVSLRVKDEPLRHMLRRYLRPRRWPVLGVNLMRVRAPDGATPDSGLPSAELGDRDVEPAGERRIGLP